MGDKFYLILDGIVGVWKSFSKEVKFTPEEYLNHLFNLKSKNENYILLLFILVKSKNRLKNGIFEYFFILLHQNQDRQHQDEQHDHVY